MFLFQMVVYVFNLYNNNYNQIHNEKQNPKPS